MDEPLWTHYRAQSRLMPETLSIVDAHLLARWTIDRGLAPVAHGIEEMDTTRIVEVPV